MGPFITFLIIILTLVLLLGLTIYGFFAAKTGAGSIMFLVLGRIVAVLIFIVVVYIVIKYLIAPLIP